MIVIVKKQVASLNTASLRGLEQRQIFHIKRDAILRNRNNPEIRVNSQAQLSGFRINQQGRNEIRNFTG